MSLSSESKPVGIVVSHSHWDRAWYQPFAWYRHRLVKMIDRIIDLVENNENYSSFTLDGQTILLEDYLEIRPNKREILKKLVSEEKIRIGPWYILPDLFLVSGESIIRNLQISNAIGNEFGFSDKIGYVPDPFGHFAQLPQILRQFGIDSFVFMRGMPHSEADRLKNVFEWESPDGSRVLSFYLREGYFNLSALGQRFAIGRFDLVPPNPKKALEQAKTAIEALKPNQKESVFLLLNGMDHMPEQKELPELISYINENQAEFHLEHNGIPRFFELLKAQNTENEVYSGDLLGNAHHPILSSVWSTRVYLKQQNHRAQSNLERLTEPFMVMDKIIHNQEADHEFLTHAWKELLKNHPHDDICGCSIDEVHRENEVRFDYVNLLCEQTRVEILERFTTKGFESPKETGKYSVDLMLFNPNPFPVEQIIKTEIFIENPEGEFGPSPENLQLNLINASNEPIPIKILSSSDKFVQSNYVNNVWGRKYEIEFVASLKKYGYEVFHVFTNASDAIIHKPKTTSKIENEFYSLEIYNENLTLHLKKTHQTLVNPIRFESTRDSGDSYSYSSVLDDIPHYSRFKEILHSDLERNSFVLRYELPCYESLNSSIIQHLLIDVEVKLSAENKLIIHINYTNTFSDLRVRLMINSATNATLALSDAHFRLAERQIVKQKFPEDDPELYKAYPGEFEYAQQHQQDFSILNGNNSAFWLAAKGLHEFELAVENEQTWYCLTLHRSIAWLSVGNGRIRRPQAGPQLAVPEAQCHRKLHFNLTCAYDQNLKKSMLNAAKASSHPIWSRQLPALDEAPKNGSLPRSFSLVNWDNPMIQFSALKPTADPNVFAMRIYNLDSISQQTEINLGFSINSFQFSDLYEVWNPLLERKTSKSVIELKLEAHKIATILLKI